MVVDPLERQYLYTWLGCVVDPLERQYLYYQLAREGRLRLRCRSLGTAEVVRVVATRLAKYEPEYEGFVV